MAVALILTILPVMLIVTVLFMVSGDLGPLAAVGLAGGLALLATVFVALLRSARRQQPSRAHGDPNRSEDPSEPDEEERAPADSAARVGEEVRASDAARDVRRAEDAIARWDDEGGSARP